MFLYINILYYKLFIFKYIIYPCVCARVRERFFKSQGGIDIEIEI